MNIIGNDNLAQLVTAVIKRAVDDYRVGISRGYIHNGHITRKLHVAVRRQRAARGFDPDGSQDTRLEAHCQVMDFVTAAHFLHHPGVLETYIDSAAMQVDANAIREELVRIDKAKSSMRDDHG